ncbi:hypothetical protein [Rahnella variigena]|uniref:hypothetical protein n=1 Tax=Rahnella variigena TaxID=574964 RepID=UPI001330FCED|nr:hypothetical protein [Rahnella variigena]
MKLDIPGKPEDYFIEQLDDTQELKYKANRERLRAVVAIRNMKVQEAISNGGNPHQLSLDLNDQFDSFFSSSPAMAQVAVYGVYVEELNAATASIIDETHRINAQSALAEERNNILGQVIGVIVVIAIAAVVIINL